MHQIYIHMEYGRTVHTVRQLLFFSAMLSHPALGSLGDLLIPSHFSVWWNSCPFWFSMFRHLTIKSDKVCNFHLDSMFELSSFRCRTSDRLKGEKAAVRQCDENLFFLPELQFGFIWMAIIIISRCVESSRLLFWIRIKVAWFFNLFYSVCIHWTD